MKVYISGKITGNPCYKSDFERAAHIVEASGCEVINPANNELPASATWADYMRVCIRQISEADGVYMLRNWHESKGAKIEHQLARDLGLKVYYEEAEQ